MRILGTSWGGLLAVGLTACVTGSGEAPRTWIDARTAVSITAQTAPLVLSREDFPAGVNVRDYVELGAFEVNRSGLRKRYLAFTLWSTIDRSTAQWIKIDADFASVTLWADDQPLQLKRSSNNYEGVDISKAIFSLPAPNAREMYYEVTLAQLVTLARAQRWTLSPGRIADGEQLFTRWRGSTASLSRFMSSLTGP
jgi:hypothetical protein